VVSLQFGKQVSIPNVLNSLQK